MPTEPICFTATPSHEQEQSQCRLPSTGFNFDDTFLPGGLFLQNNVNSSLLTNLHSSRNNSSKPTHSSVPCCKADSFGLLRRHRPTPAVAGADFLSVSLSAKSGDGILLNPATNFTQNAGKLSADSRRSKVRLRAHGAMNTTKHLWAGAVAAMVSRTCVAPLERLKLEYIVRGEKKNLFELVRTIAVSQGLKGFWKGNFVNVLRTAPFKAVNFYAYDTYRKQLLKLSGNEQVTNLERFVAGAAAGITATMICIPLDTIRTKMVAPGGEALGGVVGAFRHVIRTEGFISLYKGLLPSILSVAPSGAVFYGVYDILKSAYLRSPEGKERIEKMKQQGQDLNALAQLELGPVRTLLHGAISGACAEASTYPFEVIRRRLQLQGKGSQLNTFGIFVKIIENGGFPALYTGLVPSLLQVLPSAAISYFVYEFMKIVLKVE
ncbi:probable mitochondrial adenine nucleotide transporter BTL3 [Impatiens glandulifera]|uniref:probable mitochondrial adenine nucleotide transporter BTL3 n=1 Tax=Impatiens glandulifera TaxID=253017 RepID=UPI001FB18EBF|nr:probable mitochondrial adenine nucleotide transporter BTL3 [Impatiens glandulifera]XP_047306975.1 probable mitochondrial adenine nucleotide transporter BTL3 [Impatiens glandulifera]